MKMFPQLRNRGLQILILGFILLTIYMYYRTTVEDFHPLIEFPNASNMPAASQKQQHSVEIFNLEPLLPTLNKNKSTELPINSTLINNSSSSLVDVASLSTSSGLQSQSSASTFINLSTNNSYNNNNNSNNNTNAQQATKQVNSNTSGALKSAAKDDTTRAIYVSGHDVVVPEKCPQNGKDMNLVIVVMSAPTHIEARTAIRQTWGHFGQRTDVSIVFMLGTTVDAKIKKLLEYEQKLYADIIRGRFIDSYSNLTLKTLSALEWVDNYCSNVKFMLKTDDDMFINVPRLLAFVKKHEKDKNIIFGRLARKWKPIRNKKSKYYVSQQQFQQKMFPDFTTGPAYLMSRDVVPKLHDAAMNQTYLKLEDVFTTGIVAHKLGIKRVHVSEFLNKRITYSPCNVQRGISIHMVKYGEQFDLWKKLLDGKSKCK